jgi:PKD repeat protein
MKFTLFATVIGLALITVFAPGCKKKKDPDPGNTTTPAAKYDFTWSDNPRAGLAVSFKSTAPEGRKLTWKIDTTTTTERMPLHIFQKAGVYNVSMVVDSDFANMVNKTITVDNPFVSFSYTGTPVVGDTIRFHTINGSSATTFNWDFGDGSTSTDTEPAHIYSAEGTYSIKLRVDNKYDAGGNVKIVIINDPLYTYKITGNKVWQFNTRYKYSNGFDTSYTTTENFSINAVDKLTISTPQNATLGSLWLEYNQSLSKGNVLVFANFFTKLYYDHVMDTLYITDYNSGKTNFGGQIVMGERWVTGSSK